jgi:hypothetical protein
MSEMLKESVYREKVYMYSVFHSSNQEEEANKTLKAQRKAEEKATIPISTIQANLSNLSRTANGSSYAYLEIDLSSLSLTSIKGLE